MEPVPSFRHLSDADLTSELARLVHAERASLVSLIASLAEFDRRRLFLPAGCSSLFAYCRDFLHLGDGAAYRRIETARAYRRFPIILELIADGSVSLTTVTLLSPHLTERNHRALLQEATHLPTRDVERIVARLSPRPDAKTMVRKMPAAARQEPLSPAVVDEAAVGNDAQATPPARLPARSVIAPLSPERYKLQITMSQETHDKLRQLQSLMRHSIPSGDVGLIIDRALTCLLQDLLRRKTGARKSDFRKEDDPRRPEKGGHTGLLH